jgi:BolA family transcriptional regulator, general stress-responsive regulator
MSNELEVLLRERLMSALDVVELEIINESHLHAGHAGAAGGAQHFAMSIVSPQFNGIKRTAQHRMIYAAMSDLMPHPIHALRIDAQGTV